MNNHNYARKWVDQHAKAGDILLTFATMLNLSAQMLEHPNYDVSRIEQDLVDYHAIILEMHARYQLIER